VNELGEVLVFFEEGHFTVAETEDFFFELFDVALGALAVRSVAMVRLGGRRWSIYTLSYLCACSTCSRLRVGVFFGGPFFPVPDQLPTRFLINAYLLGCRIKGVQKSRQQRTAIRILGRLISVKHLANDSLSSCRERLTLCSR
jgi:hypothetical protein